MLKNYSKVENIYMDSEGWLDGPLICVWGGRVSRITLNFKQDFTIDK